MFQFRKFSIHDDQSTMKVGTDAVLLATLASPSNKPYSILDIGTGSGVIALILAQRYALAQIDAIDIDARSIAQASQNFCQSPWSSRLRAILCDAQQYQTQSPYDLIVSNPPYFQNSLKAPDQRRTLARHNDTLPFSQLIHSVNRLLAPEGTFSCILPVVESSILVRNAQSSGLHLASIIHIHNRPENDPIRTITTFTRQSTPTVEVNHSIRNSDNTYSDWYRQLTSDFYTHLR